jgi:hypothetical protein
MLSRSQDVFEDDTHETTTQGDGCVGGRERERAGVFFQILYLHASHSIHRVDRERERSRRRGQGRERVCERVRERECGLVGHDRDRVYENLYEGLTC